MLPSGDFKYLRYGGNTTIKMQRTVGIYRVKLFSNKVRSYINIYKRHFNEWLLVKTIDGDLMYYNGLTNEYKIEKELK